MAAGLSAELKIKTKNIDKGLSRLVDSSYFLYTDFFKKKTRLIVRNFFLLRISQIMTMQLNF